MGRFCGRCLYRRDLERAQRAHVLVVNHALLLSGGRLPPCDAMVIDEAHTFPDVAAEHFGAAVTAGRFQSLCDDAAALARRAARAYGDAGGGWAAAERRAAACAEAGPLFLRDVAMRHGFAENVADEPSAGGSPLAKELCPEIEPEALPALESAWTEVLRLCPSAEDELEARAMLSRVMALRQDLKDIFSDDALDTARWIEWHPVGVHYRPERSLAFELRRLPFDVAERLEDRITGRDAPVIMTSATLSSGRGLAEFKSRAGLVGARELALDSPFDFRDQAALLVLADMPEPSDEAGYAAGVARSCLEIIPRVPGGIFLLFSSWRMLRRVHGLIRRKVRGRPLLVQGAVGNEALLDDFKAAGDAVLLGVDTFWQGVDVPGAALSCVVLTKLPFPNFTAPVEAARRRWFEALGRSYFEDWSLPRAVLKLRQGFGRLIRTAADRGAVVLLDSRVLRKRYGEAFLEALPVCRRLSSVDELGTFFRTKARPRRRRRRAP
jgi:ATP-dependent DNA helicase DinG